MATGTVDISLGLDIATAFELPPNFYEVIFLLGLVVQAFFVITPVCFGAGLSFFLIFLISRAVFGEPISSTPIQSAVFLGMTFLVTDPATSPKSSLGRFVFGLLYGLGVMLSFIILRMIEQPAFFDKLLVVPVVNLLTPWIDRLTAWRPVTGSLSPPAGFSNRERYGWLAAYVVLFLIMTPSLKAPKTRPMTLLPPPAGRITPDLEQMVLNHVLARQQFPEAYRPFGFTSEISHYQQIRAIYLHGSASGMRNHAAASP